jgi:hypothetical protein
VTPKLNVEQTQTTNLVAGLRLKVDERQDLVAQRDRILAEIATLNDEISRTMAMEDVKTARVGPYLLTLVENSGRLTLDKHRLVELGVAPETITAATVRGAAFVSLQIRTDKEE